MENNEFIKKVEIYVEDIILKCMNEVNSVTYGKPQGELHIDNANNSGMKPGHLDVNASGSCVIQFAERLVDACLKEGVKKIQERIKMKKILSVGIVALDLVNVCEEYPAEDFKTNAIAHYMSRGGNAANTATVLAHLGAPVEYFGTMVGNQWAEFLQNDFKNSGVSIDNCIYLDKDKHKTPIATIILSQKTGTRSAIVDFEGITGPKLEQFASLNLANYSWIHLESRSFEGRPKEIEDIIELVRTYNDSSKAEDKLVVSIELEQPRSTNPEFSSLLSKADVVFIGKDYATDLGYSTKEEAVRELSRSCMKGAILVCAWGSDGAAAMTRDQLVCTPAFTPEKVVDTLGAGDTFNAGVVFALNRGKGASEAIVLGCQVAGYKCGHKGFSCVKDM